MWNGRLFEGHTSARPVKIFTVKHSPTVGFPNTSWTHVNDCSIRIQAQELVLKQAESAQPRVAVYGTKRRAVEGDMSLDTGSGAVDGNSEGGDLNSFVATVEEEDQKRVG